MKLLFDHNLSPSLVERLSDVFPGSEHVFQVGLDEVDDLTICEFAVENGLAVVTKDADYSELLSLRKTLPGLFGFEKAIALPERSRHFCVFIRNRSIRLTEMNRSNC